MASPHAAVQLHKYCYTCFPGKDLLEFLTKCEKLTEVFNDELIGIARVSFGSTLESIPKLEVMFSPVSQQVRYNFAPVEILLQFLSVECF